MGDGQLDIADELIEELERRPFAPAEPVREIVVKGRNARERVIEALRKAFPGKPWEKMNGSVEIEGVDVYARALEALAPLGKAFDESQHPRDEKGRWASVGGVELAGSGMATMRDAVARGAWDFKPEKVRDTWGEKITTLSMLPKDIPHDWVKATGRQDTYYDPALAHVSNQQFGFVALNEGVDSSFPQKEQEPGILYRGMSYDEYQAGLKAGAFTSRGDYNIGDAQKGLTYFSSDPQQSYSYAHSFAPYSFGATPSRPAVVVAVRDPGDHVVNPRYPTEIGLRGSIPVSSISHIYVGRPAIVQGGRIDLVERRGLPPQEGSRMSPSATLIWKREELKKFNENHDEKGRFASAPGVGTAPPKDKPVTLVFGGSFNPPRQGHAEALKQAMEYVKSQGYTLSKAVVVPSPNRLINKKLGESAYPLNERVELSKRQFAGIPDVEVSGVPAEESERKEGKLRRTDTADSVSRMYPGTTVVAVTGNDEAPAYPGEHVPQESTLYRGKEGTNHAGYYYLSLHRPAGAVSSTQVRTAIREGKPLPAGELNADTEAYLHGMFERLPHIKKFNENHDERGRFSSRPGMIGSGDVIGTQEPQHTKSPDWPNMVLEQGKAVAKRLGYDPDKVSIETQDKTFELNGKTYNYAGAAELATGDIKLWPSQLTHPYNVRATAAHEVMHQKFEKYLKDLDAESKQVMNLPKLGVGSVDDVMRADGTLKAPFDKQFPLYQQHAVLTAKTSDKRMREDDGVSNYSREWWDAWRAGKALTPQAYHETLAEIAAQSYLSQDMKTIGHLYRKKNGFMSYKKLSPGWRKLYKLVNDHWDKRKAWAENPGPNWEPDPVMAKYNPDEVRDDHGRWTSSGVKLPDLVTSTFENLGVVNATIKGTPTKAQAKDFADFVDRGKYHTIALQQGKGTTPHHIRGNPVTGAQVMRELRMSYWMTKYNHMHDEKGRFASGEGAAQGATTHPAKGHQLYVDLDGVLADFDAHHKEVYGYSPERGTPKDVDWEKLNREHPDFYRHIPPMSDMKELWDYIKPFHPIVLTAQPKDKVPNATQNKREWVAAHLGPDVPVEVTLASKKNDFAKPGDLLIDDYPKYQRRWEKKGGTWVTHTSAADTIKQLKALGWTHD